MWRNRFATQLPRTHGGRRWLQLVGTFLFAHGGQRPARFHFDDTTTARKGKHRIRSLLPPSGMSIVGVVTGDLLSGGIRHVLMRGECKRGEHYGAKIV